MYPLVFVLLAIFPAIQPMPYLTRQRITQITVQQFVDDEFQILTSTNETRILKLGRFIWSSCSGPNALLSVNKLEISDPVSIPGNITVAFDSVLSGDVQSPLKIGILVQKKIGFVWVDVPCINNVGSCSYDDFCPLIPFPPELPCPDPFPRLGIPCHCPVSKGSYNLPGAMITIPDEHIPEFLARGHYNVRVQASANGMEVMCLKFNFSLA